MKKIKDKTTKEMRENYRKIQWQKQRKKWVEDEEYSKKQAERKKKLMAKNGYENNIAEGKAKKEKTKEYKAKNRQRIIEANKKRRPSWAK